jgi:hypothetical protein
MSCSLNAGQVDPGQVDQMQDVALREAPVLDVALRVAPLPAGQVLAVDAHSRGQPVLEEVRSRGTVAGRAAHRRLMGGIRAQAMVADPQKATVGRAKAGRSAVARAALVEPRHDSAEAFLPVVAVALAAVARRSAHLNAAGLHSVADLRSVVDPDSLAGHHSGGEGLVSVEPRLASVADPPLGKVLPHRCGRDSLK